MQRGQADKAADLYTEALADATLANDRRASLLNDRGVAFSRLNRLRAAIDDFNRSVQLGSENAAVYNNRGNVLMALGLPKEAEKDFDRALLLAPGYAAAYINRAHALVSRNDTEGAIRDYSHAVQLLPQNPAALNGRGRLHLAQNRPHAALRDFSRAVGGDVRFGPGYRARAEAKIRLGRFEDAIEDLSRAVAFDAANAEIYLNRGYAYLAAKNAASAIKDFGKAAELEPKSSAALEGQALANAKAEDYDEALNDLAKAMELDGRSAQAYAYRAVVYKWMSQPELGQKDLERAVRLDADRPEVQWARGEFAELAGQTEEAIGELRKAVARRPVLREAVAALERLGAPDNDDAEVRELAFERWRVFVRQGRYHATNPEYPKLSVPLEMIGEGAPKIVGFDVKKGDHKGVGVLHFIAGQAEGKGAIEEIEQGAVIDLQGRAVVAVETVRQGTRLAAWDWGEGRLVVTGLDGFKEDYPLRLSRPKEVAQPAAPAPKRVTSSEGATKPRPQPSSGGTPSWAPWAQQQGSNGGTQRQPRQQQPKSLFDLIFKN